MSRRSEPLSGAVQGALVGALLTAPLMAVFYLADRVAGLPLVMYDLFDWLTRVLPGDIVIRTIEFMVKIIRRLNVGNTSSTAKTVENALAMLTFFGGGIVAGAVLFVVLRRLRLRLEKSRRYVPGLIAGIVMGLPMILISRHVNVTATASASANVLWLAAAFLVWGALLSWSYYRAFVPSAPPAQVESSPALSEQPASVALLSRREFLIRVGGASATVVVVGAGLGRYLQYRDDKYYKDLVAGRLAAAAEMPTDLPNGNDPVTPAPGTRPEYTPLNDHYRIDINSRPPEIDVNKWRLQFSGLVDQPLTMTIDDLKTRYEPLHQYVTLSCISNPVGGDLIGTTRWTGARLQDVLADVGVKANATHLKITAEDGFYETLALDHVRSEPRIMLTYFWDSIPLLYEHGFPLRIYIPDLHGMKQPKWITGIEAMDHDEDGYWVERGWDKIARMHTVSVIDVVATDNVFEQDGQKFVPIGGIAHAGARSISKVEVKVDDGDWVATELRHPLSQTTWVIWRYNWPFNAGRHTFQVRAYDGTGALQVTDSHGTFPSGATGINKLTRDI
ncbi:MAG TPA: molybdopterin-dependent oxidoreductase [Aggregatilineaceae bacterium]|nr:molybdopterin-dependent oxidoreductase [Aggregatilineaceae bacterium]